MLKLKKFQANSAKMKRIRIQKKKGSLITKTILRFLGAITQNRLVTKQINE